MVFVWCRFSLLIVDSCMSLYRVDFAGRGELSAVSSSSRFPFLLLKFSKLTSTFSFVPSASSPSRQVPSYTDEARGRGESRQHPTLSNERVSLIISRLLLRSLVRSLAVRNRRGGHQPSRRYGRWWEYGCRRRSISSSCSPSLSFDASTPNTELILSLCFRLDRKNLSEETSCSSIPSSLSRFSYGGTSLVLRKGES